MIGDNGLIEPAINKSSDSDKEKTKTASYSYSLPSKQDALRVATCFKYPVTTGLINKSIFSLKVLWLKNNGLNAQILVLFANWKFYI